MQHSLGRRAYQLDNAIGQLQDRWEAISNFGITHQEFLNLLAPPQDQDILSRAGEVADVSSYGGHIYATLRDQRIKDVFPESEDVLLSLNVGTVNGYAPLMPRNKVILKDAPTALLDNLCAWVIERAKVRIDFNRIRLLLSWLDRNCETPAQIRFIWPSILQLCALNEGTKDLGDRLRDVRPPKSIPALPPEVREACKMAAGTLATASLLPQPEPFHAPVVVRIHNLDMRMPAGRLGILTA